MSKTSAFLNSIMEKLKDFSELEIRTVVGDITVGRAGNKKGAYVFKDGDKVDGIISVINLVDGDVETKMSNQIVENPQYETVLSFHIEKEKQGQEIVLRNMEVLRSIASTIVSIEQIGKESTPDSDDDGDSK